MVVNYLPFDKRTPDTQYRLLLERILREGVEMPTDHGEPALTILGHPMRFPLENGFPMITERDIVSPFQTSTRPSEYLQALAEICAFMNGAQTQEQLEKFGCFWWDRWLTAENCARFDLPAGDMGPGSYGAAFRRRPAATGLFDQISALVAQIKRKPFSRYHFIDPWIPEYILVGEGEKRKVVVPPCHGWVYARVDGFGNLTVVANQRSGDAPVGVVYNLIHWAAFTMMLAQVTGLTAKELVYWFWDVHIYQRQVEAVKRMLAETEPRRFPTVTVDPTVTDTFAFRPEHFTVTDYYPGPKRRIQTPL